MPEAQQWYKMKERAAGEKRLLFMWYVYKFAGKKAVCFLTFFVCLCTFLSSKQVRNYARRNLTVISDYCKANGKKVIKPVIFNCFKNVFNFALTLVDNMEIFAGDYDVEKIYFDTEDNKKQFYADMRARKGMFCIFSHNGNINVLRMFSKNKDPYERSDVNVFLSKDQCKIFNSFLKKIQENSKQKLYNAVSLFPVEDIGIDTSIEIKQKLDNGEIVFMAGDRLSSGTANLTFCHKFFDRDINFPAGTFKMAQLMETPVYFIAALKNKKDTCKIYLKKFTPLQSKKETLKKMQDEYVEFVQNITMIDPLQFYHFYGFFE